MTYEDNKKKRSTLPVVVSVHSLASDLCFLAIFNYEHLNLWTEKKFCGFIKKVIIQKQWKQKK